MLKVEIKDGIDITHMEVKGDTKEIYTNIATLVGCIYSILYRDSLIKAKLFRSCISDVVNDDTFWLLSRCLVDGKENAVEDKTEKV